MNEEIARRLAGLSEQEQRALLAQLLRPKTAKPKVAPLSFAQERFWFLNQLDPGNTAHDPFTAVRLSGPLNVAALEQCFTQIVRRHETLRTTFSTVEGLAVQLIAPALAVTLPLINLQHLAEAEQEAQVRQMARDEAQRPFDLARGPLARLTLLRLGETQHILLLTMHHIISDDWSTGVFFREMMAGYKMLSAGTPTPSVEQRSGPASPASPPLAPLAIQYAEFAAWQRDWLQGERLETQRAYWRQQLANLAALELPTDRPRPDKRSYAGRAYTWMFEPPLAAALQAFSQREGLSLFIVLLTGLAALLHRYTGQLDIALRSPIANRGRKELEELIGYFVNTLVLRVDLAGNPTFQELLGRVREVCLGAYAHQDLPFEKVLEDLQVAQREEGRQGPLFPVMFILQNAPPPIPDVPELQLEALDLDEGLAPFELTVSLRNIRGGLRGKFDYSTELFEATTRQQMAQHFQQILASAVADPEQRLASLVAQIPVAQIPAIRWQSRRKTAYVAPHTPVEETLAQIWAEVLGLERVGIYDNFFQSGGDSLLSMRLLSRMKEQAGLQLTPRQFMEHPTIAEQAELGKNSSATLAEQDIITGQVPLTPPQGWFLGANTIQPERWAAIMCVEVYQPLNVELLRETLCRLLAHHDGLRARFIFEAGEWRQFIVSPAEVTPFLIVHDFSTLPPEHQQESILRIAHALQNNHCLATAPLLQVAYLALGPDTPARLLISFHHLIMDGFSLGIIFEDFQRIYGQMALNQPVSLPLKTTSFKTYAEQLLQRTRAIAPRELDYWLQRPWERVKPLRMDNPTGRAEDTYARVEYVLLELGLAETQALLSSVKAIGGTQLKDFFLTAMALAFKQWQGLDVLFVKFEHLGRSAILDELDLSRTVGWMATVSNIFLEIGEVNDLALALTAVVQQVRAAPMEGLGLGLLESLAGDAECGELVKPVLALPQPHIFFNYLSNQPSRLQSQTSFFGPAGTIPVESNDQRNNPLELVGNLEKKGLTFNFHYGPSVYHRSSIEELAELYRANLQALIAACSPK